METTTRDRIWLILCVVSFGCYLALSESVRALAASLGGELAALWSGH